MTKWKQKSLIKKKWQEYTELYKKDLNDPDNHDGMVTYLEPDILECEVKWGLGSITMLKARGGDGIPAELFQILKDDAVKELHLICQKIWKTRQWPQDWKRAIFIPILKKGSAKEHSNYHTTIISHTSNIMFKILHARVQKCESGTSTCSSWIEKSQRNQRSDCQCPLDHRKSKRIPYKHLLLLH